MDLRTIQNPRQLSRLTTGISTSKISINFSFTKLPILQFLISNNFGTNRCTTNNRKLAICFRTDSKLEGWENAFQLGSVFVRISDSVHINLCPKWIKNQKSSTSVRSIFCSKTYRTREIAASWEMTFKLTFSLKTINSIQSGKPQPFEHFCRKPLRRKYDGFVLDVVILFDGFEESFTFFLLQCLWVGESKFLEFREIRFVTEAASVDHRS